MSNEKIIISEKYRTSVEPPGSQSHISLLGESAIIEADGVVRELWELSTLANRVQVRYPEATLVWEGMENWVILTFSTEDGDLICFGASLREAIESFHDFDVLPSSTV